MRMHLKGPVPTLESARFHQSFDSHLGGCCDTNAMVILVLVMATAVSTRMRERGRPRSGTYARASSDPDKELKSELA